MKKLLVWMMVCMLLWTPFSAVSQETPVRAEVPVLVTSCGQSSAPLRFKILMKQLNLDFVYELHTTAADLTRAKEGGKPYKTLIITTGASLKGMGAAGVSVADELARVHDLIEEAKKQGILLIGAHVEGMERRAQGAAPGDTSDEQTIDAVCPRSDLLVIREDGDEDHRFSLIAKEYQIPMMTFEKNMELKNVLQKIFQ